MGRFKPWSALLLSALIGGCNWNQSDRSSVLRIPQRPFDRAAWRAALPDDAYRGRVRYSMYKDVKHRVKRGTPLVDVLAEYGPPSVFLSAEAAEHDPFGKVERPPGTAFGITYYIAQDPAATFGLNQTFCFDKGERLIKTVEHW